MNEFDDDLIADALAGRAGSTGGDLDGALAAVTGRAAATRRRRAAVVGMTAMSAVIAVGVLNFAARPTDVIRTPSDPAGPSGAVTDPVDVTAPPPPTTTTNGDVTPTDVTTDAPTTTGAAAPAPTATTEAATTVAPPPGDRPPASTGSTAPAGSTPPTAPPTTDDDDTPPTTDDDDDGDDDTPPTTDDDGDDGDDDTPPTTDDDTPPTTDDDGDDGDDEPAGTPPFSGRTYTSPGGSIVVTWDGTDLRLDGSSPAAGYTASVDDDGPGRIRVDFDGVDEWRIEVRVDDGVVTSSVTS